MDCSRNKTHFETLWNAADEARQRGDRGLAKLLLQLAFASIRLQPSKDRYRKISCIDFFGHASPN